MTLALFVAVVLCVYAFFSVGWVGVLRKAGVPAWYAFVPWSHPYLLGRLTGRSTVSTWFAFGWIPAMHDLARCFGKRDRFGYGLVFLTPVFLLILGFGRAQYLGPLGTPSK